MTAPKPKVWMQRRQSSYIDLDEWTNVKVSDRWEAAWMCPACHVSPKRSRWSSAIQAATAHSCTHTAERIADELDQRKDEHRDIAAYSELFNKGFAAYHYGEAKGYERSARLIREHLATPTGRTNP